MDDDDSEGLVGVIIFLGIVAWLAWSWFSDTKWRYALQYGIDNDQVTIGDRPHDCDFMHAPLGDKGCRYDKVVYVVKRSKDPKTSRPMISYDDGKTWDWNDGDLSPSGTSINIGWNRVDR
jgi:hypothetical protein